VWAIDPGSLAFDPTPPVNVTHLRMKAEDSHDALAAAGVCRRGGVKLLVCDANMSPSAVAGLSTS
jgi:hypothetical protein